MVCAIGMVETSYKMIPNYPSYIKLSACRLRLSAKSASQQCFSLKKNQPAVLSASQIGKVCFFWLTYYS
jgi:hypothetical protein